MPDTYRPLYQFSPPAHKMNDPKGRVYFGDDWHPFMDRCLEELFAQGGDIPVRSLSVYPRQS